MVEGPNKQVDYVRENTRGLTAHAFNSSTQWAEAGGSFVSLRLA